jgi:esterase/lipase
MMAPKHPGHGENDGEEELLDDEQFWAAVDAAYKRLRADSDAWESYMAEVNEWDVALGDGLENEPP